MWIVMIWNQKTVLYTLVTKEEEKYLMHHILYEVTNNNHYRWLGVQEKIYRDNELCTNIKEICNETGVYGKEVEVTPDLLKNQEQADFITMTLYEDLRGREAITYH